MSAYLKIGSRVKLENWNGMHIEDIRYLEKCGAKIGMTGTIVKTERHLGAFNPDAEMAEIEGFWLGSDNVEKVRE